MHTTRASSAYLSGDFSGAITQYKNAIPLLYNSPSNLSRIWSNISECHLRQMDWHHAEMAATWSIDADEGNARGWFCRAKARFLCGSDYAGAVKDAERALEIEGGRNRQGCGATGEPPGMITGGDCGMGRGTEDDIRKLWGVVSARKKILEKCSTSLVTRENNNAGGLLTNADSYLNEAMLWKSSSEKRSSSLRNDNNLIQPMMQINSMQPAPQFCSYLEKPACPSPFTHSQTQHLQDNIHHPHHYFPNDDTTIASHLTEEEWTDELLWWEHPPYLPPDHSLETMKLLAQFRRQFGIVPPYDRMDLSVVFRGGFGLNNYLAQAEKLLKQQFGSKSNGWSSDAFARTVSAFEMSAAKFMTRQFGAEKTEARPTHPTDWHFDHYGTLCALVHAAYATLGESERRGAEAQSRLAEATLTGWEDTVTVDIAMYENREWYGPPLNHLGGENGAGSARQHMPESWKTGDGCALMERAWEIWCGTTTARVLANKAEVAMRQMQTRKGIGDGGIIAEDGNNHGATKTVTNNGPLKVWNICDTALNLPTLHLKALQISQSREFTANANTGWDCLGDMLDVYTRILICLGSSSLLLDTESHNSSHETSEKNHMKMIQSLKIIREAIQALSFRGPSRIRLLLIQSRLLAKFKKYHSARDSLCEALRGIAQERERRRLHTSSILKTASTSNLKDQKQYLRTEFKEAVMLLAKIKLKRGPLPTNLPLPSKNNPKGWYTFRIPHPSQDEDLYNAILDGEHPCIDTWYKKLQCPNIRQLHVEVHCGATANPTCLSGISRVFPNLERLVVETVRSSITDGDRSTAHICPDLDPITEYAKTLTHFELHLQPPYRDRRPGDRTANLKTLGSLFELKYLHLSHFPLADMHALKFVERLYNLESFFYKGSNGMISDHIGNTLPQPALVTDEEEEEEEHARPDGTSGNIKYNDETSNNSTSGLLKCMPHQPLLLDLSNMHRLKECIFAGGAAFCSELELRADIQAFRPGKNLEEFTLVETMVSSTKSNTGGGGGGRNGCFVVSEDDGYDDMSTSTGDSGGGMSGGITKALMLELMSDGVEVHVIYAPMEESGKSGGELWRRKMLESGKGKWFDVGVRNCAVRSLNNNVSTGSSGAFLEKRRKVDSKRFSATSESGSRLDDID